MSHPPAHDGGIYTTPAAEQGLIRSIGVSNFGIAHLQKLAETAVVKPAVNQIELHPWLQVRRGGSMRVLFAGNAEAAWIA